MSRRRRPQRLLVLAAAGAIALCGVDAVLAELDGPRSSPAGGGDATEPGSPRLYLIGDFGYPSGDVARVGAQIRDHRAGAPGRAVLVELGDNLYRSGPSADPVEAAAQFRPVLAELGLGMLVMIPGNHDHDGTVGQAWENSPDGYGAIENEMIPPDPALDWHYHPAHLEPSDDPRCPVSEPIGRDAIRALRIASAAELDAAPTAPPQGALARWACLTRPERTGESVPGIALIAVDSQVLIGLARHRQEPAAAIQWDELERLLTEARAAGEVPVVLGHHPLESYGRHRPLQAGRVAFGPGWPSFPKPLDYLLAVPVLAQLGTLGYYAAGSWSDQDVHAPGYHGYRHRMLEVLARHEAPLFVAGHDHSLSFMDLGKSEDFAGGVGGPGRLFQIVSGATANLDPISQGPAILYGRSARGHVRLALEPANAGAGAQLVATFAPLDEAPVTFRIPVR